MPPWRGTRRFRRAPLSKGPRADQIAAPADARDAFWSAVKANGTHIPALRALLAPMAREPDGAELLDFCDALPQSSKDTALVRAHRAIALSRVGRIAEALQIVDLDRHVARVPFDPPAQFGAIDQFNRHLADDILADRAPAKPASEGFDYNPAPQFRRSETFLALREFIKSAIDNFLDEARGRGLDAVMPPPPKEGHLYESSTVLRGPGYNGEHVHGNAYVSSVYHVLVPDSVGSADDSRGALALGSARATPAATRRAGVRDISSRWRVRWSSSHPIFFMTSCRRARKCRGLRWPRICSRSQSGNEPSCPNNCHSTH